MEPECTPVSAVSLTIIILSYCSGEVVTGEELGGARMHSSVSGITDHFAQGSVSIGHTL